jgi:hypothetical protein
MFASGSLWILSPCYSIGAGLATRLLMSAPRPLPSACFAMEAEPKHGASRRQVEGVFHFFQIRPDAKNIQSPSAMGGFLVAHTCRADGVRRGALAFLRDAGFACLSLDCACGDIWIRTEACGGRSLGAQIAPHASMEWGRDGFSWQRCHVGAGYSLFGSHCTR